MSGAVLIGLLILAIVFFIIGMIDDFHDIWPMLAFISLVLFAFWLIAIPISRIDSKTNAEYIKELQITIDSNRQNEQNLNVLERTAIIDEINSCNMKITMWNVKGKKWYNNKWYYHPSTQSAKFIR
jgi:UDP-N-acetylmuramyl pentapeptide phosphotransferase/UDP-N-acetylglucosamine-1-phosphate transferase